MATAAGIANIPQTFGAVLYKATIAEVEGMSVDGFTIGTEVFCTEAGGKFVLSVSSDAVDDTTVLSVSGYDPADIDIRWLAFTAGASTLSGDVTGTADGTDIETTLVKVGGVAITATGSELMTAATAAAARGTLGTDVLKAGTALTDSDQTLQPATDAASSYTQSAALTANRTKTLGTTSVVTGTVVQIVRRDTANFTMEIVNGGGGAGTLFTFGAAPATAQAATFTFDGTNWAFLNFVYVGA